MTRHDEESTSSVNNTINYTTALCWAQSTLSGQNIFAQKYIYEKLAKCPSFT